MSKTFADLIAKVNECGTKKVAVAVAQDSAVLEAVKVAKERRIADAILVGDEAKIREIAASLNIDLNDFEIVHVEDVTEAARTAVKLVHEGKADMYMKGLIDTKGFLKSVLDKEVGLRTGKPLSHVCVFDVEGIDHLLFLTDVAFIPYPTLEDKVNIIKNTLEITRACGIENPKVAPLAAVEVVNPKMPVTVEAAELTQMNYEFYPEALEHVLRRVAEDFHGDLYVTENGIATSDDTRRVAFIDAALNGVAACIRDGLPVKSYFHWSLLDNFEWQKGYSMTFGLIAVDRSTQTRHPKESLRFLGSWNR